MAQTIPDRHQLLGRDAPFVDQLVQHREVIERRQVSSKIEGQAGRLGDGDSVGPTVHVRRQDGRALTEDNPPFLSED